MLGSAKITLVLCVGVSGVNVSMEFSEDESFDLTQQSVKDYEDIPSGSYGENIIEGGEIVSLEGCNKANFYLGYDGLVGASQKAEDAGVAIEEISDDEDVDSM